ncbi:flagellin [Nocardioides dongkuii]|uniref:flagellin N-terminal helical domain-containing protein n=1 Tax=Nocardioides dongkuii TaxID=2760089 RepID=UPI0015FAC1B0|nr:flagellin [Nocardioides dongkuii]
MSLRINQNTDAFNTYRNLSVTQGQMSKSLEKLSSGFRINRAADDASGLAISEGLRAQTGGLKVGVRNAQDGISVAQTAEGALTEVHSMLQRMNDLSVQYANGIQNDDSKAALSSEFSALKEEIDRIADKTTFNGVKLFDGKDLTFQVGSDNGDIITIDGTGTAGTPAVPGPPAVPATAARPGALSELNVAAVDIEDSSTVKAAITTISAQRAELGAVQNRFEHTIASTNVAIENLSASESRIRDTDMASEMMNFTRAQILSQAGTSMLAQANQAPQGVLSLLR